MAVESQLDFQQLFEAYQPRVQRYLTGLVGKADAEDLTQEVFLRASRSLDHFRGEAQVSTWLFRIATNAAIDLLRSASYNQASREIVLDEECESRDPCSRIAQPMENHLLQKDRANCFMGYMEQLPLKYRLVFLLKELEERTNVEIADILGISQAAVKIRLHRGRNCLFQILRANCKPEEWL